MEFIFQSAIFNVFYKDKWIRLCPKRNHIYIPFSAMFKDTLQLRIDEQWLYIEHMPHIYICIEFVPKDDRETNLTKKLTLYPVQDSTRIRSKYIHDSTRIRPIYTRFYSHTFKLYNILLAYVHTIKYSTHIRSNYTRLNVCE